MLNVLLNAFYQSPLQNGNTRAFWWYKERSDGKSHACEPSRQHSHSLQGKHQLFICMQGTSVQWKQSRRGWTFKKRWSKIILISSFLQKQSHTRIQERKELLKKKIPRFLIKSPLPPTISFPWINSQDYTSSVNINRLLLNWSLQIVTNYNLAIYG